MTLKRNRFPIQSSYGTAYQNTPSHKSSRTKCEPRKGFYHCNGRDVIIKDCPYTIFISPALLADEEGTAYYPSANEELIEDALRKIATLQNQCFFDERESHCGVTFTLYQLRTELKQRGHSRSYQEIIKSLYILAGADIEIRTKNGQGVSIEKFMSLTGFTESERLDNPDSKWVPISIPLSVGQ